MRGYGHAIRLPAALTCRGGAAAVEFGLIASVFCLLLFGVFEVSRYYFAYDAVRTIVAETARRVQIDSTLGASPVGTQVCQSGSAVDTNFRARTALNPTGLTVCFTRTVSGTVTTVAVTGTYSFQFVSIPMLTSYLGSTTRTISESTRTVF